MKRIFLTCLLILSTAAASFAVTGNVTVEGLLSVTNSAQVTGQLTTDSLTVNTAAILKQSTANYTLTWANPAAARAISIADPGGTDVFTMNAATQTLTNKTLTTPVINGTITGTTVIPVANGGTGQSTALTPGGVLFGSSGTAAGFTAAGTQYQYLQSAGAGTPIWAQPGPASVQVFTSGVGATYTTPTGVKAIIVELVGGGGGGGGVGATPAVTQPGGGGGGGGGGAYTRKLYVGPAATYTYTVGTGGGGGAIAGTGTAGNATTFNNAGTMVTAPGGSGGVGSPAPAGAIGSAAQGGAGGAAGANGDFMATGGVGAPGCSIRYVSFSGHGGNSVFGGGARALVAANAATTTAGNAGVVYGGGGGGGLNLSVGAVEAGQTGGAGANGIIIVYEYK